MDHKPYGISAAIAFAQVSIHTRAKGHSAIATSAYRSGTKLYDARAGVTHDYSNRPDVAFSAVLLPHWTLDKPPDFRINSKKNKIFNTALPVVIDFSRPSFLKTKL